MEHILEYEKYDELLFLLENNWKPNKKGNVQIFNDDFELNFNVKGKTYRINWIKNISGRYSGKEIIKAILKIIPWNKRIITCSAVRGYNKGVKVNGYYSMFRYGFLPDGGIRWVNKVLKSSYPTMEDAVKDKRFWKTWKDFGIQYTGFFELDRESLSYKMLYDII